MKPISEADIQRAIVDCLKASPAFRQAFVEAIQLPATWMVHELRLDSAVQSVYSANGETDIDSRWSLPSRRSYAILGEVKLESGFTARQAERYRERVDDLIKGGTVQDAVSVLIAHSSYLRTANVQARFFNRTLRLEDLLEWARRNPATTIAAPGADLDEAVRRIGEGKPLGACGLYPELHLAIADECDRRANGMWIKNRTTDWIYVQHKRMCEKGVNINYRIHEAIAEIRIWHFYKGNREKLVRACRPPIFAVQSGSHLFLRLPTLRVSAAALNGQVTSKELSLIVDAFDQLLEWWIHNSHPVGVI